MNDRQLLINNINNQIQKLEALFKQVKLSKEKSKIQVDTPFTQQNCDLKFAWIKKYPSLSHLEYLIEEEKNAVIKILDEITKTTNSQITMSDADNENLINIRMCREVEQKYLAAVQAQECLLVMLDGKEP